MDSDEYALWQKARSGVVGQGMKEDQLNNLRQFLANVQFCDSVVQVKMSKTEYNRKDLAAYKAASDQDKKIKEYVPIKTKTTKL